jgi:hypothetical protein
MNTGAGRTGIVKNSVMYKHPVGVSPIRGAGFNNTVAGQAADSLRAKPGEPVRTCDAAKSEDIYNLTGPGADTGAKQGNGLFQRAPCSAARVRPAHFGLQSLKFFISSPPNTLSPRLSIPPQTQSGHHLPSKLFHTAHADN